MKQYTTPEQTAKLIELGFMAPVGSWETSDNVYSIGEVIGMLPKIHPSYHDPYCLDISFDTVNWVVGYTHNGGYVEIVSSLELIDALYKIVIKLAEEE